MAVNPLHILGKLTDLEVPLLWMLEDQMNAASQMVRAMKGRVDFFIQNRKEAENARIGITGS